MLSRHQLYETAVQQPVLMVGFIEWLYARMSRGEPPVASAAEPVVLREDFCGTANLAATWVRSGNDRRAIGVDTNAKTLRYAERYNRRPLGPAARRLRLSKSDVLRCHAKSDATASLNFSHCIYKTRPELLRYFRHARRCLKPGGLFLCDIYGGPDSLRPGTDRRRFADFTYLWEQASHDPATAAVVNHIHFRLRGGREIRRAFTYRWRLWTVPELRDLLTEAGFTEPRILFETSRGFAEDVDTSKLDAWVAYLATQK